MKKITGVVAATLLIAALSACGNKSVSTDTVSSDTIPAQTADTPVTAAPDTIEAERIPESMETADIAMLNELYSKYVLGLNECNYKKYFTPAVIARLKKIYKDEYGEDGCAIWELRTGAQDGDGASKVTGIEADHDGWYEVSYLDMGTPGKTRIKVEGGKVADYKQM